MRSPSAVRALIQVRLESASSLEEGRVSLCKCQITETVPGLKYT